MSTISERLRELADEADRLDRANGDLLCEVAGLEKNNDILCDYITAAKDRIQALEDALEWFADESYCKGHGAAFVNEIALTKARAAFLGMVGASNDSVHEAWRKMHSGKAAE